MELNVVRSELQALYEDGRAQPGRRGAATKATTPQVI
jgi:hypothetical protein